MRAFLPVVLAAAWFGSSGCSEKQRGNNETPRRTRIPPVGATSAPSLHIHDALDQWSIGHQDEAIRLFLEIVDTAPPPGALRPHDLTEQQFISLPEPERRKLHEELLAKLHLLRELTRDLDRRARQAMADEDYAKAERLFVSMKRLGAANRGPQVTLATDLVGQAIEKLADAGLAELDQMREGTSAP